SGNSPQCTIERVTINVRLALQEGEPGLLDLQVHAAANEVFLLGGHQWSYRLVALRDDEVLAQRLLHASKPAFGNGHLPGRQTEVVAAARINREQLYLFALRAQLQVDALHIESWQGLQRRQL